MLHGTWMERGFGRVHPIAPFTVVLAGFVWAISGHVPVGAGIAIGALLAYLNGVLLSRRVDFAAMTGNVAGAMIVMQVGLLMTLTIIGIATVILIRFSLATAVASAAGFAVTQMAILLAFYLLRARNQPTRETQPT